MGLISIPVQGTKKNREFPDSIYTHKLLMNNEEGVKSRIVDRTCLSGSTWSDEDEPSKSRKQLGLTTSFSMHSLMNASWTETISRG